MSVLVAVVELCFVAVVPVEAENRLDAADYIACSADARAASGSVAVD